MRKEMEKQAESADAAKACRRRCVPGPPFFASRLGRHCVPGRQSASGCLERAQAGLLLPRRRGLRQSLRALPLPLQFHRRPGALSAPAPLYFLVPFSLLDPTTSRAQGVLHSRPLRM